MRPAHGSTRPNTRGTNSPGGMPVQGKGPSGNEAPSWNPTFGGRVGGGAPNVDPGFNRMPDPTRSGQLPNRGSQGWMDKHPNGPLAQRNTQPGGMPGGPPGTDYFGQLNAFNVDSMSDGGASAGQFGQGWGGIGDAGSNQAYKVNSWLNTFTDPNERAKAMNGIGYNNYGNTFDPASARGSGYNRFNRQNANENQQTGGYSSPGIYQHQSSYTPNADGSPNMNFGGIIGSTTVGADGSAQYDPFAPKGRTRNTRTFGQVY